MSYPKTVSGFIGGPVGESLFSNPFFEAFKENELPELFKKTEGVHDDRLLTIVTALIVENRIDHLLSTFMPRYSQLSESKDYSFSMKINTLRALDFIPRLILAAADCFRNMRNDFAHNLTKTRFEDVEKRYLDSLKGIHDQAHSRFERWEKSDELPLAKVFRNVSFYCIVGLDSYVINIRMLREEIGKTGFLDELERKAWQTHEEKIREIMSRPPMRSYIEDGVKYDIYEGGVQQITIGQGRQGQEQHSEIPPTSLAESKPPDAKTPDLEP